VQERLYVEFVTVLGEEGFSLEELVIRVKEIHQKEGMPGLVGLLLRLYEEMICIALIEKKRQWDWSKCCRGSKWEYYSSSKRRFRTTIGKVEIRWRRLKCLKCKRSLIPLREALGLKSYQSKSREVERMVIEVASEQSYRRGSSHMEKIGALPIPKSTAHRWVMMSDPDLLQIGKKSSNVIMADGTGYKPQAGEKKGELRVALGFTRNGDAFPLGSWSGQSWEEIGEELRKKLKRRKKAELLICDGEPGLAEALSQLADEVQRCHWHQVHDLDRLMWWDKAPLKQRREAQSQLSTILGIELPKTDYHPITKRDKEKLIESMKDSLDKFEKLTRQLYFTGYTQAAVYMKRAKDSIFNYIRLWLQTGIITPRVSSFIERTMREIARRLKKIGFGWSKKGATKMSYIVMKRFTAAADWNAYWEKKLRITGNVVIFYRGIKCA